MEMDWWKRNEDCLTNGKRMGYHFKFSIPDDVWVPQILCLQIEETYELRKEWGLNDKQLKINSTLNPTRSQTRAKYL